MLDIQRERLKHLLANAILELWKKETGSLSTVYIEGTICITSGGGRTTVVQVSDKFTGAIPDVSERSDKSSSGPPSRRYTVDDPHSIMGQPKSPSPRYSYGPSIDMHQNTALAVAAYLDELSGSRKPQVSPLLDSVKSTDLSNKMASRSPRKSIPVHMENAVEKPKLSVEKSAVADESDISSEESEVDEEDEELDEAEDEGVSHSMDEVFVKEGRLSSDPEDSDYKIDVDGDTEEAQSQDLGDSGVQDLSVLSVHNGQHSPAMATSTPKFKDGHVSRLPEEKLVPHAAEAMDCGSPRCHSLPESDDEGADGEESDNEHDRTEARSPPPSRLRDRSRSPVSRSHSPVREVLAMDLSKRSPVELSLSSPQNYTAQVRDVIRHRLLNTGRKSDPASPVTDGVHPGPEHMHPLTAPPSLLTALQLFPPDRPMRSHFPSGPPTWPMVGRDHLHHFPPLSLSQGDKLFIPPPRFHSPLTVGLPSSPSPLLGPLSNPLMAHGGFPNFLHHSSASLPPPDLHGIKHEHPLVSPHSQAPSTPSSRHDDDSRSVSYSPYPRSNASGGPDHTDINGNMDKEPSEGSAASGEIQKVYRCEYCNKTFLFKSKYLEHLPVHTNARPFQCHLCSRTYKYKYDLRVHLRTHMGIPTKSTICPFCSVKFATNKLLRLHIKEAHNDLQRVSETECTQPYDNLPPAM